MGKLIQIIKERALMSINILIKAVMRFYFCFTFLERVGFPGSSARKESVCNARDPGSIPGSGRAAGEGIGYPLQCSWASLVAHRVKNPPATRET